MRDHLRQVIVRATSSLSIEGKCGQRVLQPAVAAALEAAGYTTDIEDAKRLLGTALPVWRSKDTSLIEATRGRRRVDIVVYFQGRLAALVETESDLNDLRRSGVTKRNGHYDVSSIALSASARYFNSYKSLERMAAAAFYAHCAQELGCPIDPNAAEARLSQIQSDSPADHNPLGVHLFLVSGECREIDHEILAPRLSSLNAELLCVRH